VQGFGGRGWGYLSKILKKLRKRVKIGEVLQMILTNEQLESKAKGYHLPGMYQTGRRIPRKPDYYCEWEPK
jgi:mRNA-degrading endonuclease YafQ of YafQ-DinJ toxin-antitoxin module